MVAKIRSGKNIRGVINYNENKVKEGVAVCIHAGNIITRVERLTFNQKLERFEKLNRQNPNVRMNTLHISLNFDKGDKLERRLLAEIATAYMLNIGFGKQPFLVYEHLDAAHKHIHIVSNLVANGGKRIDIHNIGRNESEKARKEIEQTFGLVKAESKEALRANPVKPVKPDQAVYGKSETKRSISNIVTFVTKSYKYTSLPELNAILQQFNVIADRGKEGSIMNERKGLVYSIVDCKGNKVGVPIKASSIYGKPMLSNLEKQFKLNVALRIPYRDHVKNLVDQFFTGKNAATVTEFMESLGKKNINVILRQNQDGRVYGITFVDNQNRVVFNGSDLGKSYSAKSIMDKLDGPVPSLPPIQVFTKPSGTHETAAVERSAGSGLGNVIKDLMAAENFNQGIEPSLVRKRRKKRRRGI